MTGWDWLMKPKQAYNWRFVRNVVLKTAILFISLNIIYALLNPLPVLSKITLYNTGLPGRERLPFAENPDDAYNISLHRLEGMFASHIIADGDKADDEFRVLLLGDSGVWGWLLENDENLSACLNAGDYHTADSRQVRFYNLGYPVTSVLKDALILEQGLEFDPDAAVWLTTLQAMYTDEQLRHPIMQNNPDHAREFIEKYDIDLDTNTLPSDPELLDRTIVAQRRELADLLRHQLYGVAWAVTGVDHTNPKFFEARVGNLLPGQDIPTRDYIHPDEDLSQWLSFDVVSGAIQMVSAENVPMLIINEPIFQATGLNSDTRYNDLYPRWAYDSFRELFAEQAAVNGWNYVDLWDVVPNEAFTDYPLHYTTEATCEFANLIAPMILDIAE